jgi:subtilase family serine protease
MYPKNKLTRVLIERLEARLLFSNSPLIQLSLEAKAALDTSGSPGGLSPAMIEEAYDLDNIVFKTDGQTTDATGAGETIAIVDAYGDPDIASDLRTFDANFGITNNNASGQFVLTVDTPQGAVATNSGWALEESLDVEWAHAIAPEANILLVEAPSTTVDALTTAAAWAAEQTGVVAVSMSWGDSPEFAGETAYDHDFATPSGHAGVTFLAASGDDAEPNFPSTSSKRPRRWRHNLDRRRFRKLDQRVPLGRQRRRI